MIYAVITPRLRPDAPADTPVRGIREHFHELRGTAHELGGGRDLAFVGRVG